MVIYKRFTITKESIILESESVQFVGSIKVIAFNFSGERIAFEGELFLSFDQLQWGDIQKVFICDKWEDGSVSDKDCTCDTPSLGKDSLIDWWNEWEGGSVFDHVDEWGTVLEALHDLIKIWSINYYLSFVYII